jgi:hypothetical protein
MLRFKPGTYDSMVALQPAVCTLFELARELPYCGWSAEEKLNERSNVGKRSGFPLTMFHPRTQPSVYISTRVHHKTSMHSSLEVEAFL